MKQSSGHISKLIQKFLNGKLTMEEQNQLDLWLNANSKNKQLLESFRQAKNIEEDLAIVRQLDANKAWNKLNNKKEVKLFSRRSLSIAASITFVVGSFLFWRSEFSKQHLEDKYTTVDQRHDIAPATSGAILEMSNGEKIRLSDNVSKAYNKNKTFVASGTELIIKNGKNQSTSSLNTLIVPRASFYKIILSDGTKVWMNAQSKLKFPTQFENHERRVSLEGEAYFEVAHDVNRPFFVESRGGEIKVLGTHFNVFAYYDDIRTTLVEGKVEVWQKKNKLELSPGEFASLSKNHLIKGKADFQRDLAWFNNEFYFKKATIVDIAHQLSRWYDLDVKFRGNVQLTKEYSGSIQRDVKLSQVLEMLSYVSDLKFGIQGKELIIENKI
ncbi:FecR family protein [Sphingobacterium thalpophilum]|nr:FecR family protein [Sphingobacterium thalpophilum]